MKSKDLFPIKSDVHQSTSKNYCEDCRFWTRKDAFQGTCSNNLAYRHAFLGDGKLGIPVKLTTGALCTCPEFSPIDSHPEIINAVTK